MSYVNEQAQVGEIISSPDFVTGTMTLGESFIMVGDARGVVLQTPVERCDASRTYAYFLVERAGWWQPMRGLTKLPRAWRVEARRLMPDRSYDPEAECIAFHQRADKHAFTVNKVLRHGRYEVYRVDGEIITVNGEQVSKIRERKRQERA